MAFWKRIGKKSTSSNKSHVQTSNPSRLPPKNNDSSASSSSMSLSTSGDLGDSMYNSLQRISNEENESAVACSTSIRDQLNSDIGDLGELNQPDSVRSWSRRSRLSKNLQETLLDLTALSYLQQFLESRQAGSYLTLLHDLRNYHLLSTSESASSISNVIVSSGSVGNGDGLCELKSSPTKSGDSKVLRLLNSTSSSSGFSDDTSLESPCHSSSSRVAKCLEPDTMSHSLLSESRRIIQKYFHTDSSDYLPDVSVLMKDMDTNTLDMLDSVSDVFQEAQTGVYNLLENNYFTEFLHSEHHYRYQLEIITSGKLMITDIIYNDACLFYFMEFMDQEGKRHWIEFWLAADNYRSQWNLPTASSDALIIYNKYFSLQATRPLGLADSIRSSIEENICITQNGPGPDCFENALHVLLTAMDKKYLPLFLSSPTFSQYLNEILSALKSSNSFLSRSKRSASSSTINSEVSVVSFSVPTSTPNPVGGVTTASTGGVALNTGVSNTENSIIRLVNGISNESLMIDIRHLNDPDSLWKRKPLSLTLGRLTTFGRFYSDIEFPFDRKSESKFSKAVKKFVFVEEDEEKEDMAWQVAEMIVKEVLAVTLRSRLF